MLNEYFEKAEKAKDNTLGSISAFMIPYAIIMIAYAILALAKELKFFNENVN